MQHHHPATWATAIRYVTSRPTRQLRITATEHTTTLRTYTEGVFLEAIIPTTTAGESFEADVTLCQRTKAITEAARNARTSFFADPTISLQNNEEHILIRLEDDDGLTVQARKILDDVLPEAERIMLTETETLPDLIAIGSTRLGTLKAVTENSGHQNIELKYFDTPTVGFKWSVDHADDPDIALAGAINLKQ